MPHVFDAYGTLFDVHAAVARHDAAVGPRARELSATWRAKQLEHSWTLTAMGRYAPFIELTARALDHAIAATGVDPAVRDRLLDAYRTLDAYLDARAALAALKARGERTAILSNGSPDMLADAVAASGSAPLLDHVLSVDALRLYKPRPEVYRLATDAFGCAPADIVFVSSNRWDVAGAAAFGLRPVWVNRAGAPDEYADLPPVAVVRDLAALAEVAV